MRSRACKCCPNVLAFNGSHTLDQHAITPGAASSTDSMPVISFFFFVIVISLMKMIYTKCTHLGTLKTVIKMRALILV